MSNLSINFFNKNGQNKDIIKLNQLDEPVHIVKSTSVRDQLYLFCNNTNFNSEYVKIYRSDTLGKIFLGNIEIRSAGNISNLIYNGEIFKTNEALYITPINPDADLFIYGYVKSYT